MTTPELLDDPAFEDIIKALEADRPAARPDFLDELDARAAAGFARRRPRRFGGFALPSINRTPLLAGAATLLVAVVVGTGVIASQSGNDEVASTSAIEDPATTSASGGSSELQRDSLSGGAADDQALEEAVPDASGTVPAQVTPLSKSAAPAPGRDRKVERFAELALTTKPDDVQPAAGQVVAITTRAKGIVETSNVTSGSDGAAASFTLRIPSDRLQDVLGDLAKLGEVRSLNQNTLDITREYRSARDQLQESQAERKAVLRRLSKAETQTEIDALKSRLRIVNREIDQYRRALRRVNTRATYSTVNLAVSGDEKPKSDTGSTGGWGPGDAWHDSLKVLGVAAGAILVGAAALLPLALLAILAWLASRPIVKRRREHALDAAV